MSAQITPELDKTPQTYALAQKFATQLSTWRRHIHQHPELSFEENKTGDYVASELTKMGYQVKSRVGGAGVIAEIGSGKAIGIRADMDGLPIKEDNQADYCSQNPGVMHACGHDAHTACGLGAAMILAEMHREGGDKALPGKIRFIFQPAEEATNSDGKSGATLMMDEGAINGLIGVVGLHVFPNLPTGMIGLRSGPFLAACDTFDIKITGRGCHGAMPQEGIDAIVLAAQAVQMIQTIISRRKSALTPCVLTLGGIRSTTYAPNVVAETVELTGTARYFDPAMSEQTRLELERVLNVVTAMGGSYELKYKNDNPPLVNDSELVEAARSAAIAILGANKVMEPGLQMGAEDFSFYCGRTRACFMVLGAEIASDPRALHTPRFDIDERALPIGAAMLAQSALQFLLDHK